MGYNLGQAGALAGLDTAVLRRQKAVGVSERTLVGVRVGGGAARFESAYIV